MLSTHVFQSQTVRYQDFYSRFRGVHDVLRFDVRYRSRRLQEVFEGLNIPVEGARVLDVGFGFGDLLASFPTSCRVVGADVSPSAVSAAYSDPNFRSYDQADFFAVSETDAEDLPEGPFDVVLSSHTLEHVPDDGASLRAMHARLARGGVAAIFVPIEEPDYTFLHVRNYSVQSIVERVRQAGFRVVHAEGSMYVNGHIWKLVSLPARRGWPVIRYLSAALRLGSLSLFPYKVLYALDRALFRLGFGARQALVIATRD